ncbi:hypothetical protein M407DRAFT_31138 [Tulasnella calospora MUT 4182]|uniref:AB hydrolase-1 domain-containing protein n=1 Tax=Tulasnella calospora MUT 4182 TaxID=1051891 RepID=A0A0C3LCK2_9AGAM|nr:hypothetical protein M407DRAFT_31138 [Tulasnella calospora MUT 4182]
MTSSVHTQTVFTPQTTLHLCPQPRLLHPLQEQPCPVPQSHSHTSAPYPPRICVIMTSPSAASSTHAVEIVHSPATSTLPREPQQQLVTEFASLSRTLRAGYAAPRGHNGVLQTVASSLRHKHRAFLAQPNNTFFLEFADGGNTQIQVSVGDDAPADVPTYIGVHGMAGNLNAPYLHETLSPLIKENRGRAVVFNLRGCGDSAATSPAFHHGGSTSDLGAVVTWATTKWPNSKIYVIGTSLGGVITAKTLGQWGDECPIAAAALVSPVYGFRASSQAMETNLVSRTVFNPAVGAFYAKLVKKNKDAFDIDHWIHTRPDPFPSATVSPSFPLSSPPSIDPEAPKESRPLAQDSRSKSFATSSTSSASVFSTLPSPSTPGTSVPPTPLPRSSFDLSSPQPAPPLFTEHTPKIKEALSKSLKEVTSRILPQPLTKFCKSFVASTAHYLSGDDFMAETSAVNDLPNIRVPCLAVNCADDPLMPGKDLPRSQARQSPFVIMAVLKQGGHLGTFTTKKWKKLHGKKRYHTAVVEEWFKANEALPQIRPRPQIVNAHQGFVYPQGRPEMAFREVSQMYLKLKFTRPTYPKFKTT